MFGKIKIPLFLSQNVTSHRGKPPELAVNSKIVIERITLGGMLNLNEDNDWSPKGFKVPLRGCFTLGEVQAMSREGIKKIVWKINTSGNFPSDL